MVKYGSAFEHNGRCSEQQRQVLFYGIYLFIYLFIYLYIYLFIYLINYFFVAEISDINEIGPDSW